MTTSIAPTFLHDLRELPARARLRLYGAGGRGDEALDALRADRPDVTVLEFLDTFQAGERQGLPVRTLAQYLETRKDGDDALILITSTFFPAILERLEQAGIEGASVLVNDADPPFVACLPEDRVVPTLAETAHPLKRPPRTTRAEAGRCWRCTDFSSIYFRPTGLSFCCWLPDLAHAGRDIPGALARLQRLHGRFRQAVDADRHPFCAACPSLYPAADEPAPQPGKIRTLHLDISMTCNLRCRYCTVKNAVHAMEYDFEAVLKAILEADMLAEAFAFSWGGLGEPTLNPSFDGVTEDLIARGGSGLVYSNCVKYSKVIENHLGTGLTVVTSLDAGRPETYAVLRGGDRFVQVWDHIARYIAAAGPEGFTAKYIVLETNCRDVELGGFVTACRGAGVQNVLIAKDFYRPDAPEPILRGMGRLYRLCREAGLRPSFLGSAVSPQQQRRAMAWAESQTAPAEA